MNKKCQILSYDTLVTSERYAAHRSVYLYAFFTLLIIPYTTVYVGLGRESELLLNFNSTPKCLRNNLLLPVLTIRRSLGLRSVQGAALLIGQSRDRFPVVSQDFSVTYFFRSFHGPRFDLAPSENEYQKLFFGCKGGRCVRLTTSTHSCAECHENLGA